MFNFMLKHKRGFTLVELMIVIVLMGFGVIALGNLFQVAIRTFNKSEERYIKQEMVKSVAEYLQSSVSIGAATMAEIYDDITVVPNGAGVDNSYSYVYVQKEDRDENGVIDGYYLYKLERGQLREEAVCLNPSTPVFISFNAYEAADPDLPDVEVNQCGIKVRIGAVDSEFQYKSDEEYKTLAATEGETRTAGEIEADEIDDYIFFDTVVSYHFPNMVSSSNDVRVNLLKAAQGDSTTDPEDVGYHRCTANSFTEWGGVNTNAKINSVDNGGKILRITIDTAISSDQAASALSVSSFCFIATAGYGEATGEVGLLCDFRDNVLKTNPLGRMFVKAYYAVSPPIADFISEHEPLKAAVRVALKPLVAVAVYALEPELLTDQIPFVIMGIGAFGGIVAVTYKRRKRLA